MVYLNDRNMVEAYARVIQVNIRFYQLPSIKPTCRFPPQRSLFGKRVVPVFDAANGQREATGEATG